MAAQQRRGVGHDISSPSDKKLEVRGKLLLVLEILGAVLLVLPCVLLAIYRACFPARGKSLKGQVVLVTGAGRGLGRGLAVGFAREGCKVAVADINMINADMTVAEITQAEGIAKAYFCNVAKVEDVRSLREAVSSDLGPVDVLVNNAGLIYAEGAVEECAESEIRAVINVNLLAHFWTVREFLPAMKARNSGHIVAIASVCSMLGGPRGSAYVASKFGINGLMEVVRAELETRPDNNVKTTTVFPYFINTSDQYVSHWDLRFPPISIDQAVEATIAGVKRNEVNLSIPGYLQLFMAMGRVIPRYSLERFIGLLSIRVQPQTKEELLNHPITYVVNDISESDKC